MAKTILLILEVASFVVSTFATATPAHLESLAVARSESRTRLRGQATSSFEANSSVESDVNGSGVSVDLNFLNTTGDPTTDSKPNQALEDQVSELFKMQQGMSKEAFEATPMRKSVQKILDLIEKVMMVKVVDAHKHNQHELEVLSDSLGKCGGTKDMQVAKANQTGALYSKFSPMHFSCRQTESGDRMVKEACWEEEADKRTVKNLKCKAFDLTSKQVGDQQAQRQVMKKGGSEETGPYVDRITATICGGCVGKGCKMFSKGGSAPQKKCGYDPYTCGCGVKCKFQKAKDECDAATQDWKKHKNKCTIADGRYSDTQKKCDSLQDQMDSSSCKRAVEMKDACESYAECYMDHKSAFDSAVKMVTQEEIDRKAEWKGLKRMQCLIKAFSNGKVRNSEVEACKRQTHTTDHLIIDYPKLLALTKCEVPNLYPNTPAYKAANFAPLPALAKGKLDGFECAGLIEVSTTPATGSPPQCACTRVTMNGPFSPGPLVMCTNCLDVRRSHEKNSCPDGTKLFSPRSHGDWKTFFASAVPLRDPHFIMDVTRPQNGCGGCQNNAMNSGTPAQRSWRTSDSSPWWLRGTPDNKEPNGDYSANCYMNVGNQPADRSADIEGSNDNNCNIHSKSYYCQASDQPLTPKSGSPDGCMCKSVTLNGKYSAGALLKCTGCLKVSKSTQRNSCPIGTKIFSPRSREDWKTFIASAAPLRSPDWIIDVTQAQNGCGGCTKNAMHSGVPAQATWMTSDNSPWYLRGASYSQPSGDYSANCYLGMRSAPSEDSVTFNDHNCKYSSDAYYCQPAVMKPRPEPEEPQQEMPPAPAPAPPPLAKERCDWSSKPIVGSIEGHNIGGKHNGKTLSECQAICDAEDSCKSIDYSASKQRCYLGSCVLGGECENSGDKKYNIYACAKAEKANDNNNDED